jgi:hypothetical protein
MLRPWANGPGSRLVLAEAQDLRTVQPVYVGRSPKHYFASAGLGFDILMSYRHSLSNVIAGCSDTCIGVAIANGGRERGCFCYLGWLQ